MSANDNDVVIVDARRTAIGGFQGGFAKTPAHLLGAAVIKDLLERTKIAKDDVSEVILGQVLTAAQGQNPARQATIHAGLAETVPAWGINQVCGSGLRTVGLGFQAIRNGDSDIVIAGGQENMSLAPHAATLRSGVRMGNGSLVDTMVYDGLTDAFNDYHMGITAENIAREYQITRDDQDQFAANSQQKCERAQKEGRFNDEIVPFTIKSRKGETVVDTDEHPKGGVTAEGLGKLRAAFDKEGTVTAGNASGINDGAAMVVLMTRAEAEKRGLEPLAAIRGWAHAGVKPEVMGTGPIPASQKLLQHVGWNKDELDLIEANEAFAAQAICVNRGMGWDESKVNVNGGAIALGPPDWSVGLPGAGQLVA
jgi:acetyl-CoA C-acetyltransferase